MQKEKQEDYQDMQEWEQKIMKDSAGTIVDKLFKVLQVWRSQCVKTMLNLEERIKQLESK